MYIKSQTCVHARANYSFINQILKEKTSAHHWIEFGSNVRSLMLYTNEHLYFCVPCIKKVQYKMSKANFRVCKACFGLFCIGENLPKTWKTIGVIHDYKITKMEKLCTTVLFRRVDALICIVGYKFIAGDVYFDDTSCMALFEVHRIPSSIALDLNMCISKWFSNWLTTVALICTLKPIFSRPSLILSVTKDRNYPLVYAKCLTVMDFNCKKRLIST